ncbi:MAG: hypothetical protein MPJ24_03070 [Pirellulaceae bacterium]|nr:hypothetical protein [Pirellulaceae bacterium]
MSSSQENSQNIVDDLETRQQEVLVEIDQLDQRVEQLLSLLVEARKIS